MTFTTLSPSTSNFASTETIQLVNTLQETDMLNTATIQKLQQQLAAVTNERNAFRTMSEKVMEALTKEQKKVKEVKSSAENKAVIHAEALEALIKLRKENKALHGTLQECQEMKDQLKIQLQQLEHSHEQLKDENSKLEASLETSNNVVGTCEECIKQLTQENITLMTAQEHYEQELKEKTTALEIEVEANKYLKAEIVSVSSEKTEAHESLALLQKEIKVLRESVKKTREQAENLSSVKSQCGSEDDKQKIEELKQANNRLTKDLKDESEALRTAQEAYEILKADQTKIKETVVALRQENYRLSNGGSAGLGSKIPPPPKRSFHRSRTAPTPQQRSFHRNGSSGSRIAMGKEKEIVEIESKLKKIEMENHGLKETNKTLSLKLCEELEMTDSLWVANDRLASRICKLLAHIRQNQIDSPVTSKNREKVVRFR